jgi:hypothetical protein
MPHTEPRDYYVTMVRGERVAWLAGPFKTHTEALANVSRARAEACKVDPWCDFDAFGTSSLPAGKGPEGKLNRHLAVSRGQK